MYTYWAHHHTRQEGHFLRKDDIVLFIYIYDPEVPGLVGHNDEACGIVLAHGHVEVVG